MNDPDQIEVFPEARRETSALRLRWVRDGKTITGDFQPGISDPEEELLSLAVERRTESAWDPVFPESVLTLVNACAPERILHLVLEVLEEELESAPVERLGERIEALSWLRPTDGRVLAKAAALPATEFAAVWQQAATALPDLAERLAIAAPRSHLLAIGRQELVALLQNTNRTVRRAAATAAARRAKGSR